MFELDTILVQVNHSGLALTAKELIDGLVKMGYDVDNLNSWANDLLLLCGSDFSGDLVQLSLTR